MCVGGRGSIARGGEELASQGECCHDRDSICALELAALLGLSHAAIDQCDTVHEKGLLGWRAGELVGTIEDLDLKLQGRRLAVSHG
jgi:hypothetical protein